MYAKSLILKSIEIAKLKDLKKSTNQKHNQSKNCASKKENEGMAQ
jgi:hypothetical protein